MGCCNSTFRPLDNFGRPLEHSYLEDGLWHIVDDDGDDVVLDTIAKIRSHKAWEHQVYNPAGELMWVRCSTGQECHDAIAERYDLADVELEQG